jgi:hypothetical protein
LVCMIYSLLMANAMSGAIVFALLVFWLYQFKM